MITPIAALCLSLFGLLCGLAAARFFLVRSLSQRGKHLSQVESQVESQAEPLIEAVPQHIASTASSITSSAANLPALSSANGINTASGTTTVSGSTSDPVSLSAGEAQPESRALPASGVLHVNKVPPVNENMSMAEKPSTQPPAAPPAVSDLNTKLKPAEIAFLLRGGDVNHTIIVLAVDLIQRSLKSKNSSFSDSLADYEKSMWTIVSRSLKNWATQKVQQTIVTGAKNPIAAVRRIAFLYNFFKSSLRGLISDTIADPRQLKKYFSPHGVIRIIIDFTSSGYKMTFQDELRKSLLRRGLLVHKTVRASVGKQFFAIGAIGLIATLVVSFLFLQSGAIAVITWFSALVAAFIARTLLALRHLIPFYEELGVVVDQIRRKSFRLEIIKFVLRSINAISWGALVLSLGITLGFGFIALKTFLPAAGWIEFGALASMTITNFAIADFIFNGFRLHIEECPTRTAEKQLHLMRQELEHTSPLEAFKTVLASPDYDPTFSKILALYGIETLLILI